MLKQGQMVQKVAEPGAPLFGKQLLKVAAALVAQYKLASNKSFGDITELVDGVPKRESVWVFDVTEPITFELPDGSREKVSFETFWKRLEDEDWCREHPGHPITYLANMVEQVHGLQWKLRAKPGEEHPLYGNALGRHIRLRKGKKSVVLPAHLTPEEQAEELKKLGW